jgi:drug/metabolite transporter (DMT)-like permease
MIPQQKTAPGGVRASLVRIHVSVLLFGMIGLFGKWIALPAPVIIAGRVMAAAVSLFIVCLVRKKDMRPPSLRDGLTWCGQGVLMGLHWIAFFKCVQMASVAAAVLTFATAPVFVSVIEPFFFHERFSPRAALLSLVCLAGVALLLPHSGLAGPETRGVLWGLGAGISFAFLSVFNRKALKRTGPLRLMLWQCLAASVALSPMLLFIHTQPRPLDIGLIVLLGTVFTALAHGLFVSGMTHVSAHAATVIVTLEPLYAIVFAWLLLGETVTLKMAAGGALIMSAAFFAAMRGPEAQQEIPAAPA